MPNVPSAAPSSARSAFACVGLAETACVCRPSLGTCRVHYMAAEITDFYIAIGQLLVGSIEIHGNVNAVHCRRMCWVEATIPQIQHHAATNVVAAPEERDTAGATISSCR